MVSTQTLPRWRRRTPTTDTSTEPPTLPPLYPVRPRSRIAEAVQLVRAEIDELRDAIGPSTPHLLDGRLGAMGCGWDTEDQNAHESYLGLLDRVVGTAEAKVAEAKVASEQPEEAFVRAWNDYRELRLRLGGTDPGESGPASIDDLSANGQPPPALGSDPRASGHRAPEIEEVAAGSAEPAALVARPAAAAPTRLARGNFQDVPALPGRHIEGLTWFFVVSAVVVDIAAFYPIVIRLINAPTWVNWAGTIAFTITAIGSAHTIGIGLKGRRSAERTRSGGLLLAGIVFWLALGITAFLARLEILPIIGGGNRPVEDPRLTLIAAGTFAALYGVSGVLAMVASYREYNPNASAYRKAIRNLGVAAEARQRARARISQAEKAVAALEAEDDRAKDLRSAAEKQLQADVNLLMHEARLQMARVLADDAVTEQLTKTPPTWSLEQCRGRS